jgi:hypothetical protein
LNRFSISEIEKLMFCKDDDVLHFGHDVHVNAAIMVFAGGGQALTVLMVVSTMALDEMALSTLSIPAPAPAGWKVPQPARFPRRAGAEKDRTEYIAA